MKTKTLNQIQETLYFDTLDNGLDVYLLPRDEMEKTFGIFSTKYGSVDRTFTPLNKDEYVTVPDGIAHFLEHKMFEKEDGDVFQQFTKQGASANAFTSFTRTAYLFTSTENVNENVETLLDFVQEPYFTEETVEKEKGIIAQEIKMYDDQPDWRLFFGTIGSMYESHPVKIDIAGTVDSIQEITKDDLYTCYETFYHPSNMILFVTGKFDPEDMMRKIKENQGRKSFHPADEIKRSFPEEPVEVAKKEKEIYMPVSVSKCLVGIKEDPSQLTKDKLPKLKLVTQMVYDFLFSKSGPYYEELYNENLIEDGFDYEVHIEENFAFSFVGGNTQKPKELSAKLKEMLLKIKNEQWSDEVFARMKRKQTGDLLKTLNSLEGTANQFIDYHQLGLNYFDLYETLNDMTKEEFEQILQDWISEERISTCYILPE
ncbi:insulinase family protein [Virgibacillus sp. MSP4-1]|uniref:EF-P 5-aminopentanol modification-associated protein YfmH n=1 Tax=Virgibacillus sp. MSP4-1 TaxID=2700081 RepID=UPI00039BCC69|nr:pitrilysin family protein [Virgibacillus sp. MSP4-1]QHS22310.1 insulinase family protein [Virgibacillus sp. MSP4-1]